MSERVAADLCIIGAGPGGLAIAGAAAQLGARTVLVERRHMGGQTYSGGAVPMAALAAAVRRSRDYPAAMAAARAAAAALAPGASAPRMIARGVRVIRAEARFLSSSEVGAGDCLIAARRIVIATGSVPATAPIAGLDRVPYLTSDSVFENRDVPRHLVIVGGGPTGLELGSAHRRLGARVTILEAERVLGREDPELAALLALELGRAGVEIVEGARAVAVEIAAGGVAVTTEDGRRVAGSHLLVAAGRRSDLGALDLAAAGIATDAAGGLVLDRRLRTSNRRVYAVGDAAGEPFAAHRAADHAGIVLRNVLFRWPAKVREQALPSVVHTAPELARVGLDETAARARHGAGIVILRSPFFDNDRARIEGAAAGLVKVVARRNGVVLGAAILGEAAGELIAPWTLAIAAGIRLKTLAGTTVPFPSLSDASKQAAASFFVPRLLTDCTRRLVRLLARFG